VIVVATVRVSHGALKKSEWKKEYKKKNNQTFTMKIRGPYLYELPQGVTPYPYWTVCLL
jgi:hypothetical protein